MALVPIQDILDLFPDNTAGEITAADMRQQTTDLYTGIVENQDNFDNFLPSSGIIPLDELYSPSSPQSICTKFYADQISIGSGFVTKLGDTMLGDLVLFSSTPPTSLSAAPKGWVQTEIQATIDSQSPSLLLADGTVLMDGGYSPVQEQGLVVKKYVDDIGALRSDGTIPLDNGYVETNSLDIATKGYVDTTIPTGMTPNIGWPFEWFLDALPILDNNEYADLDGRELNRSVYSVLFALYGNTYGDGDGSTTFNLPDTRGYFKRVMDGGAARDPNRTTRTARGDGTNGDVVGTTQSFAVQQMTGTIKNIFTGTSGMAPSGVFTQSVHATNTGAGGSTQSRYQAHFTASNQVQTAAEVRPKNFSVRQIVRIL